MIHVLDTLQATDGHISTSGLKSDVIIVFLDLISYRMGGISAIPT